MSKEIDQDTQAKLERVAEQLRENRSAKRKREGRNRALIHLGLASLEMIRKEELTAEKILPHVIEGQVDNVDMWIKKESTRS